MEASLRPSEACGFAIWLPVGRLCKTVSTLFFDGMVIITVGIDGVAPERDERESLVIEPDEADDLVADDDCDDRRSCMALHIPSIEARADWTIASEQDLVEHSCDVGRNVLQAHAHSKSRIGQLHTENACVIHA